MVETSASLQGGNLIDDQDLVDIGISNQEHRKKILKSAKHLPAIQPVAKRSNDKGVLEIKPESIDEWLKSVQLEQYRDAFHKNDYTDMYRVMKVWEVELNTVSVLFIFISKNIFTILLAYKCIDRQPKLIFILKKI